MNTQPSLGNLTPEQFVIKAIENLRTPPYLGIHSVWSRFNEIFREYFPLLDPIEVTTQLAAEGKIVIRPTRGGVLLFKASEAGLKDSTTNILNKILGDTKNTDDLTPEQFVIKAIEILSTPPYKGIHSVWSHFNEAFREHFPLLDPVKITTQLAEEGKIVIRPTRGGVLLYKPGDVSGTIPITVALEKVIKEVEQ